MIWKNQRESSTLSHRMERGGVRWNIAYLPNLIDLMDALVIKKSVSKQRVSNNNKRKTRPKKKSYNQTIIPMLVFSIYKNIACWINNNNKHKIKAMPRRRRDYESLVSFEDLHGETDCFCICLRSKYACLLHSFIFSFAMIIGLVVFLYWKMAYDNNSRPPVNPFGE